MRTIRDRIWRNEQRASRLLGLYQQILQQGKIAADDSSEQIELRLTGLVVEQQGMLRVYNRLYESVFTPIWVEKELAKLRPYAEGFAAWVDSKDQDKSRLLHGQALQDALMWAANKSLSDLDYKFLNASQNFEKRENQRALEEEKEAKRKGEQLLAKAQKKAKKILLLGIGGLAVISVVAAAVVKYADQAQQQADQAQQQADQAQQQADQAQQQADQAKEETQAWQKKYNQQQQRVDSFVRINDAEIKKYYVQGKNFYEKQQYEQALVRFELVLSKKEYDGVRAYLGDTYRLQGQYQQAIQNFNKAIDRNQNNRMAWAGRGDTYRRIALDQRLSSQDQNRYLKSALNDLTTALKLSYNYGFALSSQGQASLQMALIPTNYQYRCDWLQYAEKSLIAAINNNSNDTFTQTSLQQVQQYKSQCSQR